MTAIGAMQERRLDPPEWGPSRRTVLAGLAAGAGSVLALFPSPTRADAMLGPPRPGDEDLMREAIALAAQSDFPFGAVIARSGTILSRGPISDDS